MKVTFILGQKCKTFVYTVPQFLDTLATFVTHTQTRQPRRFLQPNKMFFPDLSPNEHVWRPGKASAGKIPSVC